MVLTTSKLNLKTCNPPKQVNNIAKIVPKISGKTPVCYYAEKGPREYMEDTYQVMHFKLNGKNATFYGIFDGHGGKDVSYHLVNPKNGIFPYLIRQLKMSKMNIEKTIKSAFLEYDNHLFSLKLKAGSTATIVLRLEDSIYLINLGDSRSLVFIEGDKDVAITIDHKPWLLRERNRIFKAGYYVNPFKVYMKKDKKRFDNGDIYIEMRTKKSYIYLGGGWEEISGAQYNKIQTLNTDIDTHRVCNSLALSRAFGDFYLKVNKEGKYMGVSAAVSPEPDIQMISLKAKKGKKAYVFLASDGFWDVNKITNNFKDLLRKHEPNELCKFLVKDALTKGSQDNTSVMFDSFIV
jgi:serine/threonine protein phosphatase PrpC